MPKKNSNRLQRIADLIQTTLAEILQTQMEDTRFKMVTITSVAVSPDLSFAKIYVSILEEDKAKIIIEALNRAAKYIRHLLANSIDLRITPELRFYYDDSIARGHHISALIEKALKK